MQRITKKSVTCFLQCGDRYLFIHRNKPHITVDKNLYNGIGGKLMDGEDFLSACIRETREETGYHITPEQCRLSAVVNLCGGYPEDWVMCFFVVRVPSMEVPIGMENVEGSLEWISKDEVLSGKYELVDDLHYLWHDMASSHDVLFVGLQVDSDEKIIEHTITRLSSKL